jgi:acyl-CoA synthetase (AMP-forming)/AMP-acid ligase II
MVGERTKLQRSSEQPPLSHLIGPTEVPLWNITLSELLRREALKGPFRQCVVFVEADYRATYQQLHQRSLAVAKGLLAAGIQKGDHVGILAGNCPPYVELLFATSHIGAALVVLNNTYTPSELKFALKHSGLSVISLLKRVCSIVNGKCRM